MRHAATVLVSLAGAVTLAACSSATSGSGMLHGGPKHTVASAPAVSHAPTAFPSTSPPTEVSSLPSTDPSSGVPSGAPSGEAPVTGAPSASPSHVTTELDRQLLVAGDIGPGFEASPDDTDPSPLPCTPDAPPVDDQVPHAVKASTTLYSSGTGAVVSEEVYVYSDVADALRHQQISEAGLACAKGTMGGAAITLAGPTDVASELMTNTSKAEGWRVTTSEIGGTLVLVRINGVVCQFTFATDRGVRQSVSPRAVIDRALAKLIGGK